MPKSRMINYFTCGPFADREIVKTVIGREPSGGESAVLYGFRLGIQKLNNIPNKKKMPVLNLTARGLIKKEWGANFKMYALKRGRGSIKGVIWRLTGEDWNAVKDWELVHLGWQKIARGKAMLKNGDVEKVLLLVVTQKVDGWVDGMRYDQFLGQGARLKRKMIKIAQRARKLYLQGLR